MISVKVEINGKVIYMRSAVNRTKEYIEEYKICMAHPKRDNIYRVDDGNKIIHNPEDGAIKLAIKMLEGIKEVK